MLILGVPLGIVETRRARSDAAARLEREADAVAAAVDDRVERGQPIPRPTSRTSCGPVTPSWS